MRLKGVVFHTGEKTTCTRCKGELEPRKMEVRWKHAHRKDQYTYLLTDVLYCSTCCIGHLSYIFQTVKDVYNHKWLVCETNYLQDEKISTKSKRNSSSNKDAIRAIFEEQEVDYTRRKPPIISHGSPRSRTISPHHNSAGIFIHSKASRKWDNYWDE